MSNDKTRMEAGAGRVNRNLKKLNASVASLLSLARAHRDLDTYEHILDAERFTARIEMELRKLAKVSGRPTAVKDIEAILAEEIPVEMGYTREGWFHLRFPRLLPKKEGGSAEFVRGFLYPAVSRYFREVEYTRRFSECVVIFRHVYDEACPENQLRDHDNIELNMVIDTIAIYVMEDDTPLKCRHYYLSAPGPEDHTEVYVVPLTDWPTWVQKENEIPGTGMEIEKDTSFLMEYHM